MKSKGNDWKGGGRENFWYKADFVCWQVNENKQKNTNQKFLKFSRESRDLFKQQKNFS